MSYPEPDSQEGLDRVVGYLLTELGDDLHWVLAVENDEEREHTLHCINTSVQEELYEDLDYGGVEREMVFSTLEKKYLYDLYGMGEMRFSVEYFKNAVIIKFLVDESSVFAVAVEVGSTRKIDHTSVALECLEILED